jgi:hypothetical protein
MNRKIDRPINCYGKILLEELRRLEGIRRILERATEVME